MAGEAVPARPTKGLAPVTQMILSPGASAILLLARARGGLGLNVLGRSSSMPAAPATVIETEAADVPAGDLPIIGDPIRDLTIWWSNRLSDSNRASLNSLAGRQMTPIDPM